MGNNNFFLDKCVWIFGILMRKLVKSLLFLWIFESIVYKLNLDNFIEIRKYFFVFFKLLLLGERKCFFNLFFKVCCLNFFSKISLIIIYFNFFRVMF